MRERSASLRARASSARLLSLLYVMFSLNNNSSIVLNGRAFIISVIAVSPKPLIEDRGCTRVPLSFGSTSHSVPERLMSSLRILNPARLTNAIAVSLRSSGSFARKAHAHSAG